MSAHVDQLAHRDSLDVLHRYVVRAVVLALPTWLLVTIWNPIATAQHWTTLSFWPTLGLVVVAFTALSIGRITRQVLAALQAMR